MLTTKRPLTVLTEDELARLLEQVNPSYPAGERNGTMLWLMVNADLQFAEVTALKWRDVNLTTGKLVVRHGKGSKDRTLLWVAEGDTDRLRSWRERQTAQCGKCDRVFTTLQGKALDSRYVLQILKRYAVKAGIDRTITPHAKRYSFAIDKTELVEDLARTTGFTKRDARRAVDGLLEVITAGITSNNPVWITGLGHFNDGSAKERDNKITLLDDWWEDARLILVLHE